MNLFVSYISGILAAFTPCVIVLIPILLYKFFGKDKNSWKSFSLFILGFVIFYVLLAYVLASIFNSQIQNGFKLGLGILFVILGILSLLNRLNPMNMPVIRNSFVMGTIFAIIAASNPCSIPYISIIVSNSNSNIILNILLFGLGIITPAIVFALVGKRIVNITKLSGKIFHSIHILMSIILIASGIYLAITIKNIHSYDVYAAAVMLIITFSVLLRSFFIINNKKEIFTPRNIILLTSLTLIIVSAIYHCDNHIDSKISSAQTCSMTDISSCEICQRCIIIFSIAAILGFIGTFILDKYRKKS